LAFLTPIGHPSSLLVYGSEPYQLADFVKVDKPFTVICVFVAEPLALFWKVLCRRPVRIKCGQHDT
jgi:di/tricarboxylate transporter